MSNSFTPLSVGLYPPHRRQKSDYTDWKNFRDCACSKDSSFRAKKIGSSNRWSYRPFRLPRVSKGDIFWPKVTPWRNRMDPILCPTKEVIQLPSREGFGSRPLCQRPPQPASASPEVTSPRPGQRRPSLVPPIGGRTHRPPVEKVCSAETLLPYVRRNREVGLARKGRQTKKPFPRPEKKGPMTN